MKFRLIPAVLLVLLASSLSGCAKKADPERPIAKIQKEILSMSSAELESNAVLYAAAIRAEKARITKIQDQIKKMSVDQFFKNKSMTREISETGRRAEALFERYRIYVQAFRDKGGDLSKVQIEPGQITTGGK